MEGVKEEASRGEDTRGARHDLGLIFFKTHTWCCSAVSRTNQPFTGMSICSSASTGPNPYALCVCAFVPPSQLLRDEGSRGHAVGC